MTNITRRTFLKKGSLVIAVTAIPGTVGLFNALSRADEMKTLKPHAFLEIGMDDTIIVWLGQTNLGQGTHTGIPMIIADELDADWKTVTPRMALAGEPFKDPVWHLQVTGGSTSIRRRWDMLRRAGAAARLMLIRAAADHWGLPEGKCQTREGKVLTPDGRTLTYGQLVEAASKLPVPKNPPLKDSRDYQIIGTERQRFDIPDKVEGRTVFGMDFSVPGMCIAVVARPPRYGAMPVSHDAEAAMAVNGVIKVLPFDDKIGVCAKTTWDAIRGRDALDVRWSDGSHPDFDDSTLDILFKQHLQEPGNAAKKEGDAAGELANADKVLEARYALPFIAHAPVEPLNATAYVEKGRCRIWAPTQGQTFAQFAGASITGLSPEEVEVMTLPAGGGFGIRAEPDPIADAVQLSKLMGQPVKVVWTREDNFAHDYFRPGSQSIIRAGLNEQGRMTAWSHHIASPSILTRRSPEHVENGIDHTSVEGAVDTPYTIPNHSVTYALMEMPVPVGFWRSVGYSVNVFAVESFMDEMAELAGKDPVQFRFEHMKKDSKAWNALSLLVAKSGWGEPVPEGRARGVAVTECFGSAGAHMAEVSVDEKGRMTVHKMVCAIDCGKAVFPDAIRAQAEGGVVMGLSTAFYEKVSFATGGVKTSNYHDYPVLTMADVPEIEVHITDSKHPVGGIGEPVFPSVAPAVANAVFKATGIRLRELPFNRKLLKKS